MSDVTMQELELETAELLPSRETLHCWHTHPASGPSSSFTQVNNGIGNTNQAGFLNISGLNGNLSGDNVFVL